MQNKLFAVSIGAVLILFQGSPTAFAQSGQPSAKAAVQVSETALLGHKAQSTPPGEYVDLLSTTLKTSQQKDLSIGVSFECGLFTDTLVKSKGTTDTSKAEAMVKVRVLVDGKEVYPAEDVIFCSRAQTLMAKFGGILDTCTDLNGDGTITIDECTLTDEELQLILETMDANAYFFYADDVGSGVHEVKVQARVDVNVSWQAGSAAAMASIGKGSLTVEEVRLVKGADITM